MFRQLLAALLRAGNHDPFSYQRLFFSPCTCISKRTDLPDHKDGRRLDALTHTLFRKCLQGCADHSLGRKGSVQQKCRRRLRFHSRIQKPLTDPRRIRNTHQKNQGAADPSKCLKIQSRHALHTMSGNHMKRSRQSSVRHRDAKICRNCQAGADTWNHLKRDLMFL